MADRVDFGHRADDACFFVGKTIRQDADGVRVGFHFDFGDELGAVRERVRVFAACDSDAFAKAFGKDLVFCHIKELIFQGRTAGVDDENKHLQMTPS